MFKPMPANYLLIAALAALPAVSLARSVSPSHDSSHAVESLRNFESVAADASDQAAGLDANTRSPELGWESYTVRLQSLKDDVNDLGRMLARLNQMRDSLTAADRAALDRVTPMLKEMADNTTAAVQYANRDHENFWTPTYRKYIVNLMNASDQMSSSVNHALELDKARAKEKQLEKTFDSGQ